jgi:ribosomal protein S18 acetylase RimI-like enzyme
VKVRAASARDLAAVAALFADLLRHHAADRERFGLARDPEAELRAVLAAALRDRDRVLLVAEPEGGGGLAGFCLARVLGRPGFFAETLRGEIEHVFVRDGARRGGAGRALVAAAQAALRERGVRRVELQVSRANPGALAFWRALGFRASMDVLEARL